MLFRRSRSESEVVWLWSYWNCESSIVRLIPFYRGLGPAIPIFWVLLLRKILNSQERPRYLTKNWFILMEVFLLRLLFFIRLNIYQRSYQPELLPAIGDWFTPQVPMGTASPTCTGIEMSSSWKIQQQKTYCRICSTTTNGPTLMCIMDTDDNIFGALVSSPIVISKTFYGTGECFLFKGCLKKHHFLSYKKITMSQNPFQGGGGGLGRYLQL